ncbi:MAG: hypothetical protein AAFY59_02920 [Pseudomonadota bacterium]
MRLLLAALLLATPAVAETPFERCQKSKDQLIERVGAENISFKRPLTVEGGTCVQRGTRITFPGEGTSLEVEAIRWGVNRTPGEASPFTLDITATGITYAELARNNFIQARRSAEQSHLTVSIPIDPAERTARIEADLDLFGEARIVLENTRVSLAPNAPLTADGISANMIFHSLSLRVENITAIRQIPPVAEKLKDLPDLTALKTLAPAFIEAAPDTALDRRSKTALNALVQALPAPSGDLSLTIEAPNGFGAPDLALLMSEGFKSLEDLLAPFKISVSYPRLAL